jgi:hypothetical protein
VGNVPGRGDIITNSNKLRAYTTARYLPDEALLGIMV